MGFYKIVPFLVAGLAQRATSQFATREAAIALPKTLNDTTAIALPESFISYSFEFGFFPDFAGNPSRSILPTVNWYTDIVPGNASNPNDFSINLLASLAELQGSSVILRVGGNTQDRTTFRPNQTQGIVNTYDDKVSLDFPAKVEIGPAFFESYANFKNSTIIHGLNFAHGGNCTACIGEVLEHAAFACKNLGDRVLAWEYGNEPDMYGLIGERPVYWDEEAVYLNWREGKKAITATIKEHCPNVSRPLRYIAPSFAMPFKFMDPIRAWHAGFDNETDISIFAHHKYICPTT